MKAPPEDRIEVQEDLEFQRRNWKVQRLSWLLVAALLFASLFGAFGRGPLATANVTSPGGTLRADYERVVRRSAPASIHLSAVPAPSSGDVLTISVSRDFLLNVELQSVVPEPVRAVAGEHDVSYQFAVADARRTMHAVFSFQPLGVGRNGVEIAVAGGEQVRFSQFVLP